MTTRKKKPFWTKLLSALLIASMLMGTAGISSLAAGAPEADTVSGNSVTGDENTETPAVDTTETDLSKGAGDIVNAPDVTTDDELLKTDSINDLEADDNAAVQPDNSDASNDLISAKPMKAAAARAKAGTHNIQIHYTWYEGYMWKQRSCGTEVCTFTPMVGWYYTIPSHTKYKSSFPKGYSLDHVEYAMNGNSRVTVTEGQEIDIYGTGMAVYFVLKCTHDWSGWKYNNSQHWKECTICGEKKDQGNHSHSSHVKKADCYSGGYTYYDDCECGHKKENDNYTSRLDPVYNENGWYSIGNGQERNNCVNCGGNATNPDHYKIRDVVTQKVSYTVNHYYRVNGTQKYSQQTSGSAAVGTVVYGNNVKQTSYNSKDYTYNSDDSTYSITLNANGSNVLNLYYDRTEQSVNIIYKPGVGGNGEEKSYTWSDTAGHTVKSTGAVGFTPKKGYKAELLYWQGSDGKKYSPGGKVSPKPTSDLILTAVWQPYYNYILYYNKGKVGSDTVEGLPSMQGSGMQTTTTYTFTLSDQAPTREGYRFLGWSTTTTGEPMYQPGGQFKMTNTTPGDNKIANLYALWESTKPALTLTKTADKASYKSGETITYTVTLKNNSDVPVGHVNIYEDLDKAFSSYSNYVIDVTPSKGTWGQIDNTGKDGYLRYLWSIGDSINTIAPKEEVTLTLKVKAPKVTTENTPVNNKVTVKSYALVGNDKTTWVTDAAEVAKTTQGAEINVPVSPVDGPLLLRKTASEDTVTLGDTVEYTIHVENPATNTWDLENLTIVDPLPEGFEFVSAKVEGKEPGGMFGDGEDQTWKQSVTPTNNIYEITSLFYELYPGYSVDLTITAKAVQAGVWTNTATVKKNANDPGTDVSSDPVTVENGKGLTITKQRENNATTAKIGDTIWWTVKVKNNSNVEKTVTLTEQLSGAKLMETKTEPLPDTAPNTLTLTLNAGDEKIVYAGYVVEETDYNKADHKLINTVTTNDPDNPEVKDHGTTIDTPSTTLTVEKKADKEKVVAGEEVTYTITVTNGSQYDAENVVIADPLTDANLEFVSWKLNDGTESDVAPSDGKYEIGTVNGNASATLTITAKVSENAAEGTKISNTVTVSYSNKPDDPSDPDKKIDDPTDSEEIEVVDEPTVLTIKKTANKEKVAAGDTVKYTITVENTGDVAAKNVKVTDELPKELTFVSAKLDGSDVTANADGEYEIPVLSGKTKTELVITATVDTDAVVGTELENTATADYKNKPEKDPDDPNAPFETPRDTATVEVVEKEAADRIITIQYVDEDGNVLKEITVTKDPESGDPYKKDVNYDVTSEITDEFTDDEGHHYVKDREPDVPPTGTVEDEDIVIKVPYALDDLIDPTAPGADPTDPNKKGDGIPDKYQVVVTFRAVNGTVTGAGEDGTYKLVVTLVDDIGDYATPENGGKLTLTAEQIPGTTANTGYGNGVWDKEPNGAVVTGNITFTITYTATTPTPDPTPGGGDDPTPTPPGGGGGGGGGTPDPTPIPTPTPGPAPVVPVPAAVTPVVPAAPAPAATPVAATPVAAAPAAEGPAIEALEDEAVPLAAGGDEEAPELAALDDEEVPLAPGNGARWALINFALMNLAIFESLMLLIGYFVKTKNDKEDDDEKRKLKKKGIFRILSIPVAVISLIAFILTEDITLPTAFVDKYTIIMLIIAIVQTVVVALSNKKYEDEEEA